MKPRAPKPDCGHRPAPNLSRRRHDAALQAAEGRCVASGEPWSAARRRTYDLLLTAQKPRAAYDLLRHFAPGGKPPAPPVVYRALHALMRLGLVHRIETADKFIACSKPGSPHTAAFLICDCCDGADEVVTPLSASGLGGDNGFSVRAILLELRGCCPDCRNRPGDGR